MNEMTVFCFAEAQEVRTLEWDGEPWFVTKDVCDILGLNNITESLRNLDDDEVSNLSNTEVRDLSVPNRGMNIINEPGLYRLIFQSRKPEAKQFKRWVFHEVLPAIRKTGMYAEKYTRVYGRYSHLCAQNTETEHLVVGYGEYAEVAARYSDLRTKVETEHLMIDFPYPFFRAPDAPQRLEKLQELCSQGVINTDELHRLVLYTAGKHLKQDKQDKLIDFFV
jgi:prophage antirepressor-like protein